MAMKVPTVSRRFFGIEDVIKDGENGFIVDSMDQFINKINELLDDSNLYGKIIDQAKKDVVKCHSLDNIKKYLEVARI